MDNWGDTQYALSQSIRSLEDFRATYFPRNKVFANEVDALGIACRAVANRKFDTDVWQEDYGIHHMPNAAFSLPETEPLAEVEELLAERGKQGEEEFRDAMRTMLAYLKTSPENPVPFSHRPILAALLNDIGGCMANECGATLPDNFYPSIAAAKTQKDSRKK